MMDEKIFKESFIAFLICEFGAILEHSEKGFFFIMALHVTLTMLVAFKKEHLISRFF